MWHGSSKWLDTPVQAHSPSSRNPEARHPGGKMQSALRRGLGSGEVSKRSGSSGQMGCALSDPDATQGKLCYPVPVPELDL
ncbi:hypothetical protein AAY473_007991 [Plecturocebus cupreus]